MAVGGGGANLWNGIQEFRFSRFQVSTYIACDFPLQAQSINSVVASAAASSKEPPCEVHKPGNLD